MYCGYFKSGVLRVESEVAVRAAKRLFELRRGSFQGSEFVGNGLDRSGTDAATAISNKIRIEYNIQQFESLQASPFPIPRCKIRHISNSTFLISHSLSFCIMNYKL